MDFINPIQPIKKSNSEIVKTTPERNQSSSYRTRSVRSDKTHNIKFPVDPILSMKLKSYLKQTNRVYMQNRKKPLSQTKFNNMLLRFGLNNKQIIKWEYEYSDTKMYKHTNLLEAEYNEIGGPHGLAVRKNISERKVVFFIIVSVINWLERGGGSLEKIV